MNHPQEQTVLRKLVDRHATQFPPVALGLSSVILGAISICLFLLPVISIPLSVIGILLGVTGICGQFFTGPIGIRLHVAGIALSLTSLAIVSAIASAPAGYFRPKPIFPSVVPTTERPYIPPPASPRFAAGDMRPTIPMRT